MAPTFPASPGRVATDEVWLWPVNGDAGFQLTSLGGRIHSMNWALGSGSVAVSCNRYGSYDVYLVEVPSGRAIRLTQGPLYAVNPVFSPDGQHILYVRLDDKWEDHDVLRITLDGKDQQVVVQDTNFFDYSYGRTFGDPLVSPDGERVLFRSQRSGHVNIWTAPVVGGEPEPLAPEEAEQDNAAWSPARAAGGLHLQPQWHAGIEDGRCFQRRVTCTFLAGGGSMLDAAVVTGRFACGLPVWDPNLFNGPLGRLFGRRPSPAAD